MYPITLGILCQLSGNKKSCHIGRVTGYCEEVELLSYNKGREEHSGIQVVHWAFFCIFLHIFIVNGQVQQPQPMGMVRRFIHTSNFLCQATRLTTYISRCTDQGRRDSRMGSRREKTIGRQYVSVLALRLAALAGAVVTTNLPLGGFLKKGELLRNSGGAVPRWNKFIIWSKKNQVSQGVNTVDATGHRPPLPSGQGSHFPSCLKCWPPMAHSWLPLWRFSSFHQRELPYSDYSPSQKQLTCNVSSV